MISHDQTLHMLGEMRRLRAVIERALPPDTTPFAAAAGLAWVTGLVLHRLRREAAPDEVETIDRVTARTVAIIRELAIHGESGGSPP